MTGVSGRYSRRAFLKLMGLLSGALTLTPAVPVAGQRPIKIGALGPFKRPEGISIRRGAEMAVAEINTGGGVLGRSLELALGETEEEPVQGIRAVQDLVLRQRVNFLVGLFTSEVVLAVLPQIARFRVPLLVTGATTPDASARVAADYGRFKYFFRPMLNATFLAVDMLQFINGFLKERLGYHKIAIIAEDLKWTEPLTGLLSRELPGFGIEIVSLQRIDPGTQDFAPIFSRIGDADAIFTALAHVQPVSFVIQWAELQIPAPLFGLNVEAQVPGFFDATRGKAATEVFADLAAEAPLTEKTVPFFQNYRGRYSGERELSERPVFTGPITYDAVYILKEAIERARTINADPVVIALEVTDYVGASGRFQFFGLEEGRQDPFGNPHDSRYGPGFVIPIWIQLQADGRREVIWPERVATAEYIFPAWLQG
ncbi:MAG: ABC transporter substrate-binding protein [Candidatus Bipolaricaulia bacterium]